MKPKPLSELKNFTVPVVKMTLLFSERLLLSPSSESPYWAGRSKPPWHVVPRPSPAAAGILACVPWVPARHQSVSTTVGGHDTLWLAHLSQALEALEKAEQALIAPAGIGSR